MRKDELALNKYQAETYRMRAQQSQNNQTDVEDEIDNAPRTNKPKLESIPRPKIGNSSTESDWSFFQAQWSRYVLGSGMTKQQQIQHLWAACSFDLQRSLHNGNSAKITEPHLLMENIHIIAVKKVNNLVNIVQFQSLHQFSDETVTAFGTRLNGHANICDMLVNCDECEMDISFKDKLIMYQFIKGPRADSRSISPGRGRRAILGQGGQAH